MSFKELWDEMPWKFFIGFGILYLVLLVGFIFGILMAVKWVFSL